MLILSRNEGDGITLPDLDVSVEILKIQGNRVQVGVHASKDICILRTELVERRSDGGSYTDPSLEKELHDRLQAASISIAMARTQLKRGDFVRAEQTLQDLSMRLEAKATKGAAQILSESIPAYEAKRSSITSNFFKEDCFLREGYHASEGLAC